MKTALAILLIFHGLIHFLGFSKAFNLAEVNQLTIQIGKSAGLLWLLTGLLFISAAILFLYKAEWWWMAAMAALAISQVLIMTSWQDARYGTIANVIIFIATIAGFGVWNFHRSFMLDSAAGVARTSALSKNLLTEADIQTLPLPIQKYLRVTGALYREKVNNVKISFSGEMRSKSMDWFKFTTTQYNFFDTPTRLFYMNGKIKGLNVPGYHAYKNGTATMQIKPFGLISMVNEKGEALNKAETVTLFNDMCLLVPASLIDKRIQWEELDSQTVKAIFTCNGISITANLYFNNEGWLVNFISDDRIDISGNSDKNFRFSTPVKDYKLYNGRWAPSIGEAIWHYPEGEFVYGRFQLKSIEYNVTHN